MARTAGFYIGLDVGGTTVKEGLLTAQGELIAREVVPTPPLTDAVGYAAVTGGIDRLLAQAAAAPEDVRGIGLAVPAPVPSDGRIKVAANIKLDLDGLRDALRESCPAAAVTFENDANAAAMGELWVGSARGTDSFVFVTIGTGVGGGVVHAGRVVSGVAGAAGEIGHMCLNPEETRPCGCGGHGCLEQYASATGIVRSYLAACRSAGVEPVPLAGPSDSRAVFEAARDDDAAAASAIETMCDYLGRALALVACVIDPEAFVLGGGTSNSSDLFLERLVECYRSYALICSADTPIEIASLGNDAGIFGAAYVALQASRR
ncbi:glucokinase [Coriobacterium glomerans PW2]|uniref:Glucokinase n=1 Tax=Coriobacterium glomerans (strain ATCC 49209 / DSM 20642 / JCM 10262 / PW2) TaxID=700015 RepID=F2N8X5_CORGP|nr:ROK family protein [Coriobacterium glomerans]AEB07575.1 glucokinase [Coriobacterium glomerans PW2]